MNFGLKGAVFLFLLDQTVSSLSIQLYYLDWRVSSFAAGFAGQVFATKFCQEIKLFGSGRELKRNSFFLTAVVVLVLHRQ